MRKSPYRPPVYIHPVQERIGYDIQEFVLGNVDAFPPPEITQNPADHRYLIEHPGLVFRGLNMAAPLVSSDVEKIEREPRRDRYALVVDYGRKICALTGQNPADFSGGTAADPPQRTRRRGGEGGRSQRNQLRTERLTYGKSQPY